MSDDKSLSKIIISTADALKKWNAMEPIATQVTSLVNEYGEVIDAVGTVYVVVGFVWNIYSSMEKAKEDAAEQQAMVEQITNAVDGMITRATAEIKQLIRQREVQAAVNAVNAVQQGFRHDVIPYAKTYPLTGVDLLPLDLLINDARQAIETIHSLLEERANEGDGAAVMILYRNLHGVIQCKLTMDRWRHGLTLAVVTEAEYETTRLVVAWPHVYRGLRRMSDYFFSQGILYFHVGGGGRPELTRYSYNYKGKRQPVYGPDMAPVSEAFINAREASRENVIPQEIWEWSRRSFDILKELQQMKMTLSA